ncbi:MAG TPA: serine hydroxymethyltransferase, partial [SAR202 cluster bacterium]|nr:serine hydroxymethyltransferase [SAR202 cluster bacterium]
HRFDLISNQNYLVMIFNVVKNGNHQFYQFRNAIPFDTKPPRQASGIRLGTPAITSRGMKVREATTVGRLILKVLTNIGDPSVEENVKHEILKLTSSFPVPGITS